MSPRQIRVLLAAHGRVDVTAVEEIVALEPGLALVGVIDNDGDWATRANREADALLIACTTLTDAVLELVGQESASRSHMPVVVLCDESPNGSMRQAFEAGADDIIVSPDLAGAGPQVFFALEKAMTRRTSPAHHAHRHVGNLVCMLGPKGGTGKTLTASNLAVALAGESKSVALVDLDLQFGDLGLVMGLTPERSIFDLATAGGTLDAHKVDAFLSHHSSGVRVLLAPTRPDHAAAVTPDFLRDLYAILRSEYDYVVVDTPPGFTPEVIATIDSSSSVCLIGTLDAPSLKNAKLGAETLELMGYPPERVRIVLNRADSSVGVTHADVVSVLGRAPDVLVPSAREIVRSVNAGEPIVQASPRSEAAKSFNALAKVFVKLEAAPANEVNGGHRRVRGRKASARV